MDIEEPPPSSPAWARHQSATNHLDKIFNTLNEFPGVQLKCNKNKKISYQVEIKVRGVTPARNVNFGSYDSLEKAKRAYNYGAYVMHEFEIPDLPYFSVHDNRDLETSCNEALREKLYKGIKGDVKGGKEDLRAKIKEYVEKCKCAADDAQHVAKVLKYWQEKDMKQGKKRGQGGNKEPRIDMLANDNNANPSGPQAPVAQAESKSKRKRAYVRKPPIEEHTRKGPDYPDLPWHYYGIRAHAGRLGVHEYPPQVDQKGDYVCPCFFNHNFNARSKRVITIWPKDNPSLDDLERFRVEETGHIYKRMTVHNEQQPYEGDWEFDVVNHVRKVYNYECTECLPDYHTGPLAMGFFDKDGNTFFMPKEYQEYANASKRGRDNQQEPDADMCREQGALVAIQNAVQGQQVHTLDSSIQIHDKQTLRTCNGSNASLSQQATSQHQLNGSHMELNPDAFEEFQDVTRMWQ